MLGKIKYQPQSSLFFSLESTLNQKHPLFILSHKVNWEMLEGAFSPLYCPEDGCPAKPIWLMVGLLILKHLRKLSDESVVEQWGENIYYQYFCGQQEFLPADPYVAPELVHFRNHAGEKGIEAIRLVRAVERKLGEKVPAIKGDRSCSSEYWHKSGMIKTKSIRCMNPKCVASAKEEGINFTNLAIKPRLAGHQAE